MGTICIFYGFPNPGFSLMKNMLSVMLHTRIKKIVAKVTTNIGRELASESNVHVLEVLPTFQTDERLPKKLRRLFYRLDNAEQNKPLRKMLSRD